MEPELASALDLDGNVGDTPNWHADPSAGGRIGWFYPWKAHYDLELGVSGQSALGTTRANGCGRPPWPTPRYTSSTYIEAKGEWIYTWVETDDNGTIAPRGWWAQVGLQIGRMQFGTPDGQ